MSNKVKDASQELNRVEEPSKYPKEELLKYSEALFNCKPEVLVAAMRSDQKEDYTVAEAQALIDDFIERGVN